jgi:uncharacterized protein (DUF2384 family)
VVELRVKRVLHVAVEILGGPTARELIQRSHPMLDGQTPLSVTRESDMGTQEVLNMLKRGVPKGGS